MIFVCLSLILGFKPAFSLSSFTLIKRFFSSSLLSAIIVVQFSSVQSLSRIQLFVTPWTAAHQASLCFTISQTLLKLMFIELVMPLKKAECQRIDAFELCFGEDS